MAYSDKKCACCGLSFTPTASVVVFCSWQCRFISLMPNDLHGSECWDWPLSFNKKTGYGQFMVKARPMRLENSHRLSYQIFNGPLEHGEVVRHQCDNRKCFNPAHLLKGSIAQNNQDMIEKKRHCHGVRHYRAKLNNEKVIAIRSNGGKPRDLAVKYQVSISVIRDVLSGRTWKLAGPPPPPYRLYETHTPLPGAAVRWRRPFAASSHHPSEASRLFPT